MFLVLFLFLSFFSHFSFPFFAILPVSLLYNFSLNLSLFLLLPLIASWHRVCEEGNRWNLESNWKEKQKGTNTKKRRGRL
jgi:uncharacterized membrane protein YbhN (UPF0104 family)